MVDAIAAGLFAGLLGFVICWQFWFFGFGLMCLFCADGGFGVLVVLIYFGVVGCMLVRIFMLVCRVLGCYDCVYGLLLLGVCR